MPTPAQEPQFEGSNVLKVFAANLPASPSIASFPKSTGLSRRHDPSIAVDKGRRRRGLGHERPRSRPMHAAIDGAVDCADGDKSSVLGIDELNLPGLLAGRLA